jgi:DNA-binding NtrC family response regulator
VEETATVLVVDDEPRVLDELEAVLAADFRVLRAEGGEQALRLLPGADVAVIVTDYRMPGMTGVELLRRSQDVAPDAVRIVLTAYTDVDSLMDAINTGRIYHFVPKPTRTNCCSSCGGRSALHAGPGQRAPPRRLELAVTRSGAGRRRLVPSRPSKG